MSKTGGSGLGTIRFKEELSHEANAVPFLAREREFLIENLLVRIHLIIEII